MRFSTPNNFLQRHWLAFGGVLSLIVLLLIPVLAMQRVQEVSNNAQIAQSGQSNQNPEQNSSSPNTQDSQTPDENFTPRNVEPTEPKVPTAEPESVTETPEPKPSSTPEPSTLVSDALVFSKNVIELEAGGSSEAFTVLAGDNDPIDQPELLTKVNGIKLDFPKESTQPTWRGKITANRGAKPGTYSVQLGVQGDQNYKGTLTVIITEKSKKNN